MRRVSAIANAANENAKFIAAQAVIPEACRVEVGKQIIRHIGMPIPTLRIARIYSRKTCGSGLDRTYVGGIERGERNVSLVNIEKIAKAYRQFLFRNSPVGSSYG